MSVLLSVANHHQKSLSYTTVSKMIFWVLIPLFSQILIDAVACDEPVSDDLIVINYTAPALEGSVIAIAIECDTLNGIANYYTSTCVEGRWEPSIDKLSARCGGGML